MLLPGVHEVAEWEVRAVKHAAASRFYVTSLDKSIVEQQTRVHVSEELSGVFRKS